MGREYILREKQLCFTENGFKCYFPDFGFRLVLFQTVASILSRAKGRGGHIAILLPCLTLVYVGERGTSSNLLLTGKEALSPARFDPC